MILGGVLAGVLGLAGSVGWLRGQDAPAVQDGVAGERGLETPAVEFTMTPPAASGQMRWTIRAMPDGAGIYQSGAQGGAPAGKPREVRFSVAARKRFAAGYAAVKAGKCETTAKHVAQTGAKRIVYGIGPASVDCTFNYSDDAGLDDAAAAFQAAAATIRMGDELARLERFDRLGLDVEIDLLQGQVDQGYAIELGNIAPVLRALVDDERVMERVRRKAGRLLERAGE